ncbi:alpha/beta hydrolase [Nocardioides iriomotensis]|uniref:alpha/beta hydrolase n=1 Tax=Nocardioides iriomotensis TaxID=715784 RepID=UPI0013EDF72D|nr:alpha/beta hydrolase [Nocardioides iriomotensis]
MRWAPCGIEHPGYECATFRVPLDYDRPDAGSIRLAVNRLPATNPAGRIGSVFVNPGGPGGSGVGLVFSRFGNYLRTRLEGRFDVIGFDPRGAGASAPMHCFDNRMQLIGALLGQPLFPYGRGQYRPFFDAFAALGPACRDRGDPVLEHMNTADVARDLDGLREAVGDAGLTYLGFSYGSYLGNTYANLFPDKVRALVVDGVLDPQRWTSGRQIEDDRLSTQEEFNEFLRLCDEAGPECAFWTPAGSAARWAQLAGALRRQPLFLPEGLAYTYDYLVGDAASAMYAPEVWDGPNGAAALFDFLADAALGDQAGAAADAGRLHQGLRAQLRPPGGAANYPNWLDAYFGNHCADSHYPRAYSRWRDVGRYARDGSQFGPLWWWLDTGCARWEVNADRYTGPWTATTAAPVLVVGNFFDGVTSYRGATATAALLPNSRLLSYAGWGHTAYKRSACVTDYVHAYLLTVSLPPEGQVCPANPNPFQAGSGRESRRERVLVGLPPAGLIR